MDRARCDKYKADVLAQAFVKQESTDQHTSGFVAAQDASEGAAGRQCNSMQQLCGALPMTQR